MEPQAKESRYRKEFFLLLFPLFFVFHGYTENYPLISVREGLQLLLQYLLIFLILQFLLVWIFRNWRKASIYNFYLMCAFFLFGIIHDFLKSHQ